MTQGNRFFKQFGYGLIHHLAYTMLSSDKRHCLMHSHFSGNDPTWFDLNQKSYICVETTAHYASVNLPPSRGDIEIYATNPLRRWTNQPACYRLVRLITRRIVTLETTSNATLIRKAIFSPVTCTVSMWEQRKIDSDGANEVIGRRAIIAVCEWWLVYFRQLCHSDTISRT